MCTAAFLHVHTVVYLFILFSKVVKFYSGSLSMACWKMPSMEDELITPLIFGSYAPISSSFSPHDSSPPPQLDRGRVKEAHSFSPLRSAFQTPALYWYVFEMSYLYTQKAKTIQVQPKCCEWRNRFVHIKQFLYRKYVRWNFCLLLIEAMANKQKFQFNTKLFF